MNIKLTLLISFFLTIIFLGSTFCDPQEEGYVGSDSCLMCHRGLNPEIAKNWESGQHHLTMKTVSGNIIIGHEDGNFVTIESDFRVIPSESFKIDEYAPPEAPHDGIWLKDNKIDASQRCLGCHSTGYFVSQKKYIEQGVGCETCHGPGKKHVDAKGGKGSIVNPAKLEPERNKMICGQCHSQGKDHTGKYPFPVMSDGKPFQPGEDLTTAFVDAMPLVVGKVREYSTFIQSPPYYSHQNCTACHNPHGNDQESMLIDSKTSEVCMKCHRQTLRDEDLVDHWGADEIRCWVCHVYAHSH